MTCWVRRHSTDSSLTLKIPVLIITYTVSEWRVKGSSIEFIITCFETTESIFWHSSTIIIARYFLYNPYIFLVFFYHFVWVSKMLCAKFFGKFSLFYYKFSHECKGISFINNLQVTIWDCLFHLLHLVWDARTIVNQLFSSKFLPILNS